MKLEDYDRLVKLCRIPIRPQKLNPAMEDDTVDWYRTFCTGSKSFVDRFARQKISIFAFQVYDCFNYERSVALLKICLLAVTLDDFMDHEDKLAQKLDKLYDICEDPVKYFVEKDTSDPQNWLFAAWSDVWRDTATMVPQSYLKAMRYATENVLEAMKHEKKSRAEHKAHNETYYRTIRMHSVFGDFTIFLIELALGKYLTFEERSNAVIQQLLFETRTCIYLINDLYSYRKERMVHDANNILFLWEKRDGITLEQAEMKLIEELNARTDAIYFTLENSLDQVPEAAWDFAREMPGILRGVQYFHSISARYQQPEIHYEQFGK